MIGILISSQWRQNRWALAPHVMLQPGYMYPAPAHEARSFRDPRPIMSHGPALTNCLYRTQGPWQSDALFVLHPIIPEGLLTVPSCGGTCILQVVSGA